MNNRITAIVTVMALLAACASPAPAPAPSEPDTTTTQQSSSFAKLSANAIHVVEQQPGNVVIVTIVNHEQDGFVAIQRNSTASAIIGVSDLLPAGTQSKVELSLTESLDSGDTGYATVFVDDGDGVFDPINDMTITDNLGNSLMSQFTVSADAPNPLEVEIMF